MVMILGGPEASERRQASACFPPPLLLRCWVGLKQASGSLLSLAGDPASLDRLCLASLNRWPRWIASLDRV